MGSADRAGAVAVGLFVAANSIDALRPRAVTWGRAIRLPLGRPGDRGGEAVAEQWLVPEAAAVAPADVD